MRNVAAWALALALLAAAVFSVVRRFLAKEDRQTSPPGFVRLEVVNATGVARMGREVMRVMQLRGFNVYSASTSSARIARTTVVDLRDRRGGNARAVRDALARRVRVLGVAFGPELAPAESVCMDSSRYLEALLVVGGDYRRLLPEVSPLR